MKSLTLAVCIFLAGVACMAADIWAIGMMLVGIGLLLTYSILRLGTVIYK